MYFQSFDFSILIRTLTSCLFPFAVLYNTKLLFCRAAFQYGVKMSDGRKTRRAGPKDEKAALDREWQQIQNIMSKRESKRAKH